MRIRYILALFALFMSLGCSSEDSPSDGTPGLDAGPADAGEVDAGDMMQGCVAWDVDYDLAGSQFEIANTFNGLGDAVNDIGPGQLRLRFSGDDAGPMPGPVALIEYAMTMEFTVSVIETDVDVASGPEACGVAEGTLTSSVVTWSTPLRDYTSTGFITCTGTEVFCALAGLVPNEPEATDSVTDQALMPFVFTSSESVSMFSMDSVEVPNDDAGDTFLRLEGSETARQCVTELPACP